MNAHAHADFSLLPVLLSIQLTAPTVSFPLMVPPLSDYPPSVSIYTTAPTLLTFSDHPPSLAQAALESSTTPHVQKLPSVGRNARSDLAKVCARMCACSYTCVCAALERCITHLLQKLRGLQELAP